MTIKQTIQREGTEIVHMIKYKVLVDGKKKAVSYSQIHDEFLNVKEGTTLETKIAKDLKAYKNSMLMEEGNHIQIEIMVNNQEYKTVTLKDRKH